MTQTIGERNDAGGERLCWADLRDSSCEDLDSQPLPQHFLNTDSYLDTPEPSFDNVNGSMLLRLQAATALSNEQMPSAAVGNAAWQPNAAAPVFVPRAGPSAASSVEGSVANRQDALAPEVAPRLSPVSSHRFRHKRRILTNGARESDLVSKRPRRGQAASGSQQPNAVPEEITEEDWQRRHEKRRNVVQSIKTTLEYETMRRRRDQDELVAAPGTPDPDDRSVSKRKWESEVMHWRNSLRQHTRAIPGP